jgi:hypothetical protein
VDYHGCNGNCSLTIEGFAMVYLEAATTTSTHIDGCFINAVAPNSRQVGGAPGMNAWQEFANDRNFLHANQVSPSELEALKHALFMGTVTCKEDLMFLLNAIRGPARRP